MQRGDTLQVNLIDSHMLNCDLAEPKLTCELLNGTLLIA